MHKEAIFLAGELNGLGFLKALVALYYAEEKHQGQMRQDGSEYIDHPVGVARLLMNMGIHDERIVCDALLHDVVEECHISFDELERIFGREIAHDVMILSKTSRIPEEEYFGRVGHEIGTLLVKAADRVHNIGNMVETYSTDRLEKYCKETNNWVLPMIKLLGRRKYPQYGKILIVFRDFMKGILRCVARVVELSRKLERAEKELAVITKKLNRCIDDCSRMQVERDEAVLERAELRSHLAMLNANDMVPQG